MGERPSAATGVGRSHALPSRLQREGTPGLGSPDRRCAPDEGSRLGQVARARSEDGMTGAVRKPGAHRPKTSFPGKTFPCPGREPAGIERFTVTAHQGGGLGGTETPLSKPSRRNLARLPGGPEVGRRAHGKTTGPTEATKCKCACVRPGGTAWRR